MWGRISALIIKEFLATLKDKRSRGVIIALPFFQLLIFPHATTLDVTSIRLAVLNKDSGTLGRDLVARFTAGQGFRLVATLTHDAGITPLVKTGKVDLVLHIGENFSQNLKQGLSAPVQLIVDGRNSNTALILLNYTGQIVADFNREMANQPLPAHLVERAWFNPNLLSFWSMLPGFLAIITLVATLSITGFAVAREKEVGTFQQLLVTPLRPMEIVIGKTIPALIIGLGESIVILLIAVYGYEVPLIGNLLLLYLGLFFFLLSSIGTGLMISSLARTQQQALLGAFFFIVPTVILSGFASPIANMPEWIQILTYLNPMRYFLEISHGIFLKDASFGFVLARVWPMALIASTALLLAAWLFRRRLY
ncbi:ABC transporter permease [Nitrosococcus watsonii]|uniref:ABC-2 type transporter n=1 Tax=Nitrosococcus watsoni (strain C-113) TaxID=105559 RepID=D8K5S7_NITWC|nr:ABC transporter permease [Nitrosococcus watsonii]ADJ28254.1 ABC-2 type transporter [Nitrosococcus watsonii C-113]